MSCRLPAYRGAQVGMTTWNEQNQAHPFRGPQLLLRPGSWRGLLNRVRAVKLGWGVGIHSQGIGPFGGCLKNILGVQGSVSAPEFLPTASP